MRRLLGALGASLALGLLASSCSSARSALGTTNGDCFVAVPVAAAAVGHRGHLLGARLETWADLTGVPLFEAATDERRVNLGAHDRLCLVAYGGHFEASDLRQAAGRRHGRVAIAVVTYPANRLVVTILIRRSPTHFGHSHLFGN